MHTKKKVPQQSVLQKKDDTKGSNDQMIQQGLG